MNLETIFGLCAIGLVPAWLLLLVAPGWTWTDRIVNRIWIPMLFCAGWVLLYALKPAATVGSMGSLKEYMLLLNNPYSTLLVWIQLLTWDLFIGAWQVRDARRRGIRHGWVVLGLIGTFFLGPLGLLIYLGLRFTLQRAVSLQEIGTTAY